MIAWAQLASKEETWNYSAVEESTPNKSDHLSSCQGLCFWWIALNTPFLLQNNMQLLLRSQMGKEKRDYCMAIEIN
jgi:hypothetical protein